jgi:hypothetical protein
VGAPLSQAQEVRGRQHLYTFPLMVHDRRAADLVPDQQAGGVPQGHLFGQPDHIAGHQVAGCEV